MKNSIFNAVCKTRYLALLVVLILTCGNAWGETVTYTITSKTAVSTSGTAPTGSSASYSQTYTNTAGQATSGNSMTLTLTGFDGCTITGVSISAHNNKSSGNGSGSLTINGQNKGSVTGLSGMGNSGWTTKNFSVTSTVVGTGKSVVVTLSCSANSLYCQSFTITYTAAAPAEPKYTLKVPDGEGGYVTYSNKVKADLTEEMAVSGHSCPGDLDGSYSGWHVGSVETPAASPGTTYNHATGGDMPASGTTLYALFRQNSSPFYWHTNPLCEETKTLSSIAITTQPTTTKYLVGETFSNTGAVVTATYSDATTAAVSANWTPTTGLVSGSNTITATYTEGGVTKTATTTVTAYTVTIQKKDEDGTTIADAGVTASASGRSLTASVGSTHYVFHTWKFGTASGTSISNATSATTGALTGTPSAAVTVIAEFYKPCTVTWSVSGNTSTISPTTNVTHGTNVSMPTPSIPVDCTGSTFMGWTTSANASYSGDSAPSPLYNGTSPAITGDVTFYAVFADED